METRAGGRSAEQWHDFQVAFKFIQLITFWSCLASLPKGCRLPGVIFQATSVYCSVGMSISFSSGGDRFHFASHQQWLATPTHRFISKHSIQRASCQLSSVRTKENVVLESVGFRVNRFWEVERLDIHIMGRSSVNFRLGHFSLKAFVIEPAYSTRWVKFNES